MSGFMRHVRLTKKSWHFGIRQAVRVLRQGGVIIFPTETVYGLGAAQTNPRAQRRIFQLKGRPKNKPLIVHIAKKSALQVFASHVPPLARKLAREFWPGPLTLVLQARSRKTIALRMPNHPVALALIRAAGPLAAPSANFSGEKPPTRVSEIPVALIRQVDLILDAGPTSVRVPSTIIDFTRKTPRLLRLGALSKQELQKAGF